MTYISSLDYDCYRIFIQMFSDVVLGVDLFFFENYLEKLKEEKDYEADTDLTAEDWLQVTEQFKQIVTKHTRKSFPQDPKQQLYLAIQAVFNSWNNERAIIYREIHNIPDHLGKIGRAHV